MIRLLLSSCALSILLACSAAPPGPATLDANNELCASCRMPVSDASLAAQLVAPGEEPRFFDDIGCLRDYLAKHRPVRGAACYVADHRTRAWVDRDRAVYVRSTLPTPMGSHLIAFSDAASAAADPAARTGTPLSARQVFEPPGVQSAKEAR